MSESYAAGRLRRLLIAGGAIAGFGGLALVLAPQAANAQYYYPYCAWPYYNTYYCQYGYNSPNYWWGPTVGFGWGGWGGGHFAHRGFHGHFGGAHFAGGHFGHFGGMHAGGFGGGASHGAGLHAGGGRDRR
ncbi:MAG TPA: hypothetical protein VME41_00930 [Stellaceae bacterium]|nr:hypothetical protein [Stellaceae bacterium]